MQRSPALFRADLSLDLPYSDLAKAVVDACERAEDAGARVAALSLGGGRDWPGASEVHEVNTWERALRRWERLPAVTVTVADGACSGPALEVLSASDLRVAGRNLRLGLPGTAATGFWPGTVLHRLTRRIGASATRRLCLFAHPRTPLDAGEACLLGLVDEVVDSGGIQRRLDELARDLPAGLEPALLRQLVDDAAHTSFEEALGVHLAACDRLLRNGGARP
ncbi:enoyl-CoA hydratase/isomerase family protein [Streptomyces roseirectus]|uniref:Enoyl-CoA hydratase/isomerase family protein n=1 Tax=Streptomyces roseirectus TaxID=2768066 RepID=A0A7H0IQN3_9ACTN|nr:enoyl-CoA-hydratase DpgB [Streptomyces roseirectus]QNP75099.1 enoyl-CoA hydratase/isomerase family protein [Streptomyces roseirectus]